jgi:hypothetical protein
VGQPHAVPRVHPPDRRPSQGRGEGAARRRPQPALVLGANAFFETELWAEQGHEYGVDLGVAYSAIDSKLSVGVETRVEIVDTRSTRLTPLEVEWLIGPNLSWRPVPQAHVLLTAYVGPGFFRGAGTDAFAAHLVFQPTLVIGWRL